MTLLNTEKMREILIDMFLTQLTLTREIKTSFPKALRRPILRQVHFSTMSRLEQLGKCLIFCYFLH
jgi:hypothetical protein